MITVTDLAKSFDKTPVFKIPSFSLPQGITCLGGPSGCGKTTFARVLSGLEKPDQGIVQGVSGTPVLLFQEPRLLPNLTARRNVACVVRRRDAIEKASLLLHRLGFTEADQKKKPDELSGGMAQRVAIARALLFAEDQGGNLVILDEPFHGLDPERKALVAAMISEHLVDRHVLLITHEEDDAALLSATYLFMPDITQMKA